MSVLTKKLFKDLLHRKLRALLTILGIAIGIMSLTAINIVSDQLLQSLRLSIDATTQPDLQFYTTPTSADITTEMAALKNIKTVQSERNLYPRWQVPSGHLSLQISSFSDIEHIQIGKFTVIAGRLPQGREILLESSDRALTTIHVGDQIAIDIQGSTQHLTVSGFARTQGKTSAALSGLAQGYMRQEDMEQIFRTTGVNYFQLQLKDVRLHEETKKEVARIFEQRHMLMLNTTVGHDHALTQIADGVFATMRILSIVAILLSAFLLLGTIMTLITEQIQSIGTMKAIGAVRQQVLVHYLSLVGLYGLLGTALGFALGIVVSNLLSQYLAEIATLDLGPLEISPLTIIESLAIGIGIPLLAAILPLYLGTRISVHKAISGYGVDASATQQPGLWARKIGPAMSFLPQIIQFGLRNLFRKRTRAFLTLLSLTLAGTTFLAIQETSHSVNSYVDKVFDAYHFDVIVSVPVPMPISRWQEILHPVSGVTKVEAIHWQNVQTRWGDSLLTGLQTDTQLYHKQMVAGRWFTAKDKDVVIISKDAADKSGLKIGDTLSLHDTLHTANWRIIGIVVDYNGTSANNLGVLLIPMNQMDNFLRIQPNYTRTVMIQSAETGSTAINSLASRVDSTVNKAGFTPSVQTGQQQSERSKNSYQILYVLLYSVVVIVALVGTISLFNTQAMSILERRREIGILRSIGATGPSIAQVFWTEGLSLGMLAWLFSVILGIPASYAFVSFLTRVLAPIPFSFGATSILWMLLFIIIITLLACLIPVWSATRMRIAQTLRYE